MASLPEILTPKNTIPYKNGMVFFSIAFFQLSPPLSLKGYRKDI
jgi:hypothetical protein